MKRATLKTTFDTVIMMLKGGTPVEEIEAFMKTALDLAGWDYLKDEIESCKNCDLCDGTKVHGEGPTDAAIMMIGEGPGEQEDRLGRPFVGPAGQLLDKIIAAAGWIRDDLYITNTVKCRAHSNGKNIVPNEKQIVACYGHLQEEIRLLKPKIIICLGSVAANTIIHPNFKITEEHGRWFQINPETKAMAVYHPSYLLHKGDGTKEQEDAKYEVWQDILKVVEYLEEENA